MWKSWLNDLKAHQLRKRPPDSARNWAVEVAATAAVKTAAATAAAAAITAMAAFGAGCASAHSVTRPPATATSAPATSAPATSATAAPTPATGAPTTEAPTTSVILTPTLYNCGGGAYEPKTLLVVCGTGSVTVTSVTWTSWTPTGAAGRGTFNFSGATAGSVTATIALSEPVATSAGPEFSVLQATYSGSSPDGHPADTFQLTTATPR